jgi:hypothetical protein
MYKRYLILNESYLQKIIKGPASLSLVEIEMFECHTLIKIKDVFCFQYCSDTVVEHNVKLVTPNVNKNDVIQGQAIWAKMISPRGKLCV